MVVTRAREQKTGSFCLAHVMLNRAKQNVEDWRGPSSDQSSKKIKNSFIFIWSVLFYFISLMYKL
jgi:hypothetical protein